MISDSMFGSYVQDFRSTIASTKIYVYYIYYAIYNIYCFDIDSGYGDLV